MNTHRVPLVVLFFSVLFIVSCKPDGPPDGYIEFQGKNYREPNPVMYDSNGDGIADAVIEVLGTNINTTKTPDGKPLFSPTQSGSGSDTATLVPSGQRLCYLNLSRNCDTYGALYSFETSLNTDFETILEASATHSVDSNGDGIQDYIQNIRNNNIPNLISNNIDAAVTSVKTEFENAAKPKKISSFYIQQELEAALQSSILSALYDKNDYVDLQYVKQEIFLAVTQAILEIAEETGFDLVIPKNELEQIAFSIAEQLAEQIMNDIAVLIANSLLEEYNQLKTSGTLVTIQGLCPDGYHIPTDTEWMIFEMALGMPIQDLTKSGVTVINRGASTGVVQKMIEDHGFQFSGYMSINGTFAQLGEAGVFWSSTAGVDEKGEYVWVRQIDVSYPGIVRYKHYEKSGLSIRCFKD